MSLALTPAGLSTQTQAEIVDELTAKIRATFGNNTNTSTASIMGQLVNIVAEFRALDQQILLAVYRRFDPNSAVGVALDALAALTGSVRKGATVSVVDVVFEFSGPGIVNDGDLFQNDDTSTQWVATGGPYTDTGGPYPEDVPGTLAAVDPGPLIANSPTAWSLITVNPALAGVTNPVDDANPGQLQETDVDFRLRRQIELFGGNVGGLAAIRAVVSRVDGVTSVRVYHNPATPGFDADGIPFKAFNVVVETNPSPPGVPLQETIADSILNSLGAGGEAFGTDFPLTRSDSEGVLQPVAFDLIDVVDVFAKITVDTTGTEQVISTNLAAVVAEAVLEKAQEDFSGIGQNQLGFQYSAIVSDLQESGEITGVVSVLVELSRVAIVGPFVDPVEIGIRERPDFDAVNILVVVLP
jgi:hypothetical protein